MSETAQIIIAILTTIAAVGAGMGKHFMQGRRSRREGVEGDEGAPPEAPTVGSVDALVTTLVELRTQVTELRDDQVEDRAQIRRTWADLQEMRSEVIAERSLRQSAVDYIRKLHAWIAQHIPEGVGQPDVPDELAPHVTIPSKENHHEP